MRARPGIRIVSLSPASTEVAFALGAGESLVGVTRYCDFPPSATEVPKVGGWLDPELEKVTSLKPDLVLTNSFLQEKIASELRARGLAVLHSDPHDLSGVFASITNLGFELGVRGQAKRIVEKMKSRLADIAFLVRSESRKPVYVEEWHKPPMVAGNWVPELVELAGGTNCGISAGERSREISLLELKTKNPELIVLSWCGFGEKSNVGEVAERKGWNELGAVKSNSIFAIDDSLLNRPGPRLAQGMERLARLMHAECFVEYDKLKAEGHKH